MSDFDEKLNKVLSDPQAMAQIAALAQSLQSGADAAAENGPGDAQEPPAGTDDDSLLRQLVPLLRQLDRPESSETSALLHALQPFLREERRGKVDRAVQLARLIHLAKGFLST